MTTISSTTSAEKTQDTQDLKGTSETFCEKASDVPKWYPKKFTKVEYMQAYDPDIVEKDFCRKVQPIARHPIVLSKEEFDIMLEIMRKEIAAAQDKGETEAANDMLKALESIKLILNYRGNCYFGPPFFCQTCHRPLTAESVNHHKTSNHHVHEQDPQKPFPGFLLSRTSKGLAVPCLYSRSGQAYQKSLEDTGATVQTLAQREESMKTGKVGEIFSRTNDPEY